MTKVGAFLFACPVCGKRERFNDAYGLMCTGPSWRDDHEPALMVRQ